MGAVSSCCSAEPADSKETIGGHSTSEAARGSSRHDIDISKPMKTVSDAEVDAFQRRLERSIDVIVLLADGTRLTCQLKLNKEDKSLVISCDTNLRVIPLTELKATLHGRDQLRRVETKANLVDDPNCVALHMMTGNCIPIRFDENSDKNAFIETIKRIKQR